MREGNCQLLQVGCRSQRDATGQPGACGGREGGREFFTHAYNPVLGLTGELVGTGKIHTLPATEPVLELMISQDFTDCLASLPVWA
jgi:hypothetical protein